MIFLESPLVFYSLNTFPLFVECLLGYNLDILVVDFI